MQTGTFKRFDVRDDGMRIASVAADICLYFPDAPQDIGAALLHAYDRFLEIAPVATLRWYRTNTMEGHAEVTKRSLGLLQSWLKPDARPRKTLEFELRDGIKAEDTPDWRFTILGFSRESPWFEDRANWLQLLIPAELLAHDPDEFATLLIDLCDHLPLCSGHAGFVIERSRYDEEGSYNVAYPMSMRHPGLDISDAMEASRSARDSIKGVNWLTVLSREFADRLGGVAELQKSGSTFGVAVTEATYGIVLRAGNVPMLGDVNRNDRLPAYRAAFAMVKPLLVDLYPPFVRGHSDEQTRRWLHRFDDE